MKKEDKNKIVDQIASTIKEYDNFYLTDIASLNAKKTSILRKECYDEDIKLMVVKNTLLRKAFERLDENYDEMDSILKGNTAIMFSNTANAPAKLINKYKGKVPTLKGAYVQESFYIGAECLPQLVTVKSKTEVIGEIIGLLQSPAKNVISALQSGGNTIHGILQTLSEK